MGKTVQIRDVDDHTYERLKGQAAVAGLSLAQYLRKELVEIADRQTMLEILERADERRTRGAVIGSDVLRAAREGDRDDRR